MTDTNEILRRQALRWKAQERKGNIPDALYEALSEGTANSYEKRIVVNLGKISRIVADDGSIRPYSVFSKDWNYTRSVYGHTDNCELCGAAIKENCILVNDDDGASESQVIVGNVCVHRYIEIRDSTGRALSDGEKKEFLKTEMKEAKAEFKRQDFATRYPTALMDLKRWEGWMTRKWSPTKSLHRAVIKRLATHGYLGAKTMKQWEEFHATAEEEFTAWKKQEELKSIQRMANIELDIERKKKFQQQIAEKRNQFNREAQEWEDQVAGLELNGWEQEMVRRTATKIRSSGKDALTGGFFRFVKECEVRLNMDTTALPPNAQRLKDMADKGELNAWEQSFVKSVIPRLVAGRSLSSKQQAIVDKILKV